MAIGKQVAAYLDGHLLIDWEIIEGISTANSTLDTVIEWVKVTYLNGEVITYDSYRVLVKYI